MLYLPNLTAHCLKFVRVFVKYSKFTICYPTVTYVTQVQIYTIFKFSMPMLSRGCLFCLLFCLFDDDFFVFICCFFRGFFPCLFSFISCEKMYIYSYNLRKIVWIKSLFIY